MSPATERQAKGYSGRLGMDLTKTTQISTSIRLHRTRKSLILRAKGIRKPVANPLNTLTKQFIEALRWLVMPVSAPVERGRTVGICNVNVSDKGFAKPKPIRTLARP